MNELVKEEKTAENGLKEDNSQKEEKQKKPKLRVRFRAFFKDFAQFLKQGDVVDLAVAFVVGAAFRAIVSSLVADIIMPLIAAIGGVSVADWTIVLNYAADGTPNLLNYGKFIQAVIDFVIIALSIFVAVRALKGFRGIVGKSAKAVRETLGEITKAMNGNDGKEKDASEES